MLIDVDNVNQAEFDKWESCFKKHTPPLVLGLLIPARVRLLAEA